MSEDHTCDDCGRSFESQSSLQSHQIHCDNSPWRDKERLEQLYWGERMNQYEIADEIGCHQSTVKKWMKKHDIDTRDIKYDITPKDVIEVNEEHKTIRGIARALDVSQTVVRNRMEEHDIILDLSLKKYDITKSELEHLYYDEKMTIAEIAKEYGCMPNTIRRYMIEYGIERRSRSEAISLAKSSDIVFTMEYSYEVIRENYKAPRVIHHRLLAVAEYGFDAVSKRDVHHKNRVRWDNRPNNLKLVTEEEHIKIHEAYKDRWETSD